MRWLLFRRKAPKPVEVETSMPHKVESEAELIQRLLKNNDARKEAAAKQRQALKEAKWTRYSVDVPPSIAAEFRKGANDLLARLKAKHQVEKPKAAKPEVQAAQVQPEQRQEAPAQHHNGHGNEHG